MAAPPWPFRTLLPGAVDGGSSPTMTGSVARMGRAVCITSADSRIPRCLAYPSVQQPNLSHRRLHPRPRRLHQRRQRQPAPLGGLAHQGCGVFHWPGAGLAE